MTPRIGDMWHEYDPDPRKLFLFCANSTLTKDGRLVMGAGSAKVAKAMFPELPKKLGRLVEDVSWYGLYGVLVPERINVGAFQTKKHWTSQSKDSIIAFSVMELTAILLRGTYDEIHLPYPGIGHGGLAKEQVEPLIIGLPDHVNVWTYT